MAWCCVFVSWCGDQLGLIDEGAMPRFYSVSNGYEQFKNLGLWLSGNETPAFVVTAPESINLNLFPT